MLYVIQNVIGCVAVWLSIMVYLKILLGELKSANCRYTLKNDCQNRHMHGYNLS